MGNAELPAETIEPPSAVRWPQVATLGLLQIAIGLSWIVYALYLPALLISLGLDQGLAASLLVIEGTLAVVLEPTFGFLSDRTFRRIGTRLPFVVAGVFFAAALFICIPLVAQQSYVSETTRGKFLALAVAWAAAMMVFRTPAISLLSRYSTPPNLPMAASILTLFGAGVAAVRPISRDFLLSLGPLVCFGVASLVLLGVCAAVWFMDRRATTPAPSTESGSTGVAWPIVTLMALGAGMALAQFALFTRLLPRYFGILPPGWAALSTMGSAAAAFLGFCALGAGPIAKKFGNERTMTIGAAVCAVLIAFATYLAPAPPTLVVMIAIFVAAFSFVANGAIPLSLGRMPTGAVGVGLGFYFGSFSATSSIAASRFRAPIDTIEATLLTWIGLALIAAAVWAGHRPAVGK